MECNHHDVDYLTPESKEGVFCRYCKTQLCKEIIPCKNGYKGTMQMLEGQDYLLESFERNFYYYKFVTYEKGEEMKKKEKDNLDLSNECNHKDKDGRLDLSLSVFDGDIDCRRCNVNFGRITKEVERFNSSDYQEGEIQIKQKFSFLLDLFKQEFEKFKIIVLAHDKYKPLSKSDENHFKLISEVNQDIKKSETIDQNNKNDNGFIGLPDSFKNQSSGINQTSIINNQASKIAELESEVKRLEKIVIGLSEVLINERKET